MFDQAHVPILFLWTFIVSAAASLYWHASRRRGLPLPPGPTGNPILGNALSLPSQTPWITYAEWSRKYNSELVSFTAFGKVHIVVNSMRAAKELLVARSAIYSNRPRITITDMSGWGFNLGLMQYGNQWRARRRLLHLKFATDRASAFWPLQMKKSEEMIRRLYEDPDGLLDHVRGSAASLAMELAYGLDIAPKNDLFVELAQKSVAMMPQPGRLGVILVNRLPFLRYLPTWLPGMGFKKSAESCLKMVTDMIEVPWAAVERQVVTLDLYALDFSISSCTYYVMVSSPVKAEGAARPSVAMSWITKNKDSNPGEEAERAAKDASGILYAAGADTTVATLTSVVLALVVNPEVQIKAQTEIDSVVGRSRLPTFDDRLQLPYVEAVVREVRRWHQAVPLSVTREMDQDDVYMGMLIPKGAQIFTNLWAMTHDPNVYAEPDTFRPERFLTSEGTLNDDRSWTLFGFGRRVCAGQHLADAMIWIMTASILAVYTVSKAKDEQGNEIPVAVAMSTGVISHPASFQHSIKPRDAVAEALVKSLRKNLVQ